MVSNRAQKFKKFNLELQKIIRMARDKIIKQSDEIIRLETVLQRLERAAYHRVGDKDDCFCEPDVGVICEGCNLAQARAEARKLLEGIQ